MTELMVPSRYPTGVILVFQSRQKPCWKGLELHVLHQHTYALVEPGHAFWTSGPCSDQSGGNSHQDDATCQSGQSIRHKESNYTAGSCKV